MCRLWTQLAISFLFLSCFSCSSTPREARRPPNPTPPAPVTTTADRAVVVFSAALRAGPGHGAALGSLEPGAVVNLGRELDGWRAVETAEAPRVKGWVQVERLGCRALEEVSLSPTDDSKPEVSLRPGALVAIRERQGESLLVQTQGSIAVEGTIEASKCGVGQPFVPRRPRDGTPYILVRPARLASEIKGRSIELPEGQRFAVFVVDKSRQAYGRTDGPISLRGHIDATALEPDKTTPFDRLAEPLPFTHEAIVDTPIAVEPESAPFTTLPGGTTLSILERSYDFVRVRVAGLIHLEGWVEDRDIRRISLDYNELDPYARRREHGPIPRDFPREMELLDEP